MKKDRTKIIVNPEKKAIAAIYRPKLLINELKQEDAIKPNPRNLVQEALSWSNEPETLFGEDLDYKFVGVARCVGDDVFDEEFGAELAANKAELKFHRSAARAYQRAYNLLAEAADWAKKFCDYHELEQYCSERKVIDAQEAD